MKIKFIIMLLLLMAVSKKKLFAQSFVKSHHASVHAHQVITENYIPITLQTGNKSIMNINQFDMSNPYTYIQSVRDENDKTSQILYQTDFSGNILFLAYSNNLEEFFMRTEKPMFRFLSCIEVVNTLDFPTENIEKAVGCIVERLNYCKE